MKRGVLTFVRHIEMTAIFYINIIIIIIIIVVVVIIIIISSLTEVLKSYSCDIELVHMWDQRTALI